MTTNFKDLVDEEFVDVLPFVFNFSLSDEKIVALRASFPPHPPFDIEGVRKDVIKIPGPKDAPDVQIALYTPSPPPSSLSPALLWLHAGGYVLGDHGISDKRAGALARDLGIVIVSVDYRLAPENPFPAGVEDSYAALKWIHDNAARIGVNVNKIAVGGESAGAGLAASLTLLARERKEYKFVFQLLLAPMLDDRTCIRDHKGVGQVCWSLENTKYGWQSLLGREVQVGSDDVSQYASASRAKDLSNLPPAYIPVGEFDLFREESIDYARRLWQAGVSCEIHVFPRLFHAFDVFKPTAHSSVILEESIRHVLRRALL